MANSFAVGEAVSSAEPTHQITDRTVQFGFDVHNTTVQLIQGVEIHVFAPVRESAGQRCCDLLTSSHASQIVRDAHGNQALRFRFDRLPPHAIKTIQIRARIKIADTPAIMPVPDGDRWLHAEPGIQVDDPKIRAQAERLQGRDPRETARRIHDWLADHIDYAGYLRDARGALYALEKRRGDCTEYMHLVVALARANGIPSRSIGGYVMEQDGAIHADAFHNWAELHVDGAWRIADA